MHKFRSVFGVLGLSYLLISCGVSLQENEATKIINEHFGFPKPVITMIDGDAMSHTGQGIRQGIIRIIRTSGYVYNNPAASGAATLVPDYLPTEKGKGFIEGIYHNRFSDRYTFRGALVKESLDAIQEILIDKESKMVTVKYTTKFEPIEPLYSSICINSGCPFFGDQLKRRPTHKINLKKYDKGWRIPE